MWQTCPRCKGTGMNFSPLLNRKSLDCNVCDGKMIISELTGLPPQANKLEGNDFDIDKSKNQFINNSVKDRIYTDLETVGLHKNINVNIIHTTDNLWDNYWNKYHNELPKHNTNFKSNIPETPAI